MNMKRCRYIYLGFDNKNNKFYFDRVTRKVYERGQNSTSNTFNNSQLLPYGGACVMAYALFKGMKIQTGIVPIEIFIIASALIGMILAVVSSIYANRANEKMFSKCQPYTQPQQIDWEKVLGEGRKMVKLYVQLRIGAIIGAVIIAVFIKVQENPLFVLFNIFVWWLLVFLVMNINVRKSKRIIKELEQNIHRK